MNCNQRNLNCFVHLKKILFSARITHTLPQFQHQYEDLAVHDLNQAVGHVRGKRIVIYQGHIPTEEVVCWTVFLFQFRG